MKAVNEKTALPKSTIYQKIKEGTFPRPIPLGAKSVGWLESEVDEWIASCIRLRNEGAA